MTDPGEMLTCPQCGENKPAIHFECRPLDVRCKNCIPVDKAMQIHDQQTEGAQRKLAAIQDALKKADDLKPIETMVLGVYEEWGGSQKFIHDLVKGTKQLYQTGKTNAAVGTQMRILQLHHKVDRMKQDEEFRKMDDETLQATLMIKVAELMSQIEADKAKIDVMQDLLAHRAVIPFRDG